MGLVLKLKETKAIMVVRHIMKVVIELVTNHRFDHSVKIMKSTLRRLPNRKVIEAYLEGVLRNMLKLKICVAYGDTQVLWDLSLHVKENEVLC